jgi:raffinose/stachyose/melibiose transport system permease protein
MGVPGEGVNLMQQSAVQIEENDLARKVLWVHRKRRFRKRIVPWLFVLPILLINFLVVIGPSLSALYYSFTDWSGIGPAKFIGLDNFYQMLFVDPSFKRAFVNNLIWLGIFLTVPFALSLSAASLLSAVKKGSMFFRIVLFIPYVLPGVVVAQTWRFLMNPVHGIGAELANIGIRGFDVAFLGNPKTVMPAIAFVDNWQWWGFLMVIFLAAMQNIPKDLYEAARMDGADRWQEFWNVTFPGIRPTIVFMLLMCAIWSFLIFDYIWILTQGGPGGASEVLGTLVVKNAFFKYEAGYAAAIGLAMSFMAGILISIFVFLRRRGWEI